MDWQKNRLWIGGLLLIALGAAAVWVVGARTGDTPVSDRDRPRDFPDLDRDDIAVLEITRPENDESIRLERDGENWRITRPIQAPADRSSITTALDKLHELEVVGVAASSARFHERLEVDAEHAVRVVARGRDGNVLADLWIGAYRSGNTMVRLEGQERVVSVRGSIKFAFNKELRDWRDRTIADVDPDQVTEVAWTGPNGTFRFVRPVVQRESSGGEQAEGEEQEGDQSRAEEGEGDRTELGDWQIAEVSFMPPTPDGGVPARAPSTSLENFAPTKVRTMVASLARMRATDFAAAEVSRQAAGFGDASPRVTLTSRDGTRTTILLGNESNAERHDYYAMREGNDTIFVISRFLSERVHPTSQSFVQAPASSSGSGSGSGSSTGTGGSGSASTSEQGGGSADIPPEVMQQIQRQLAAQAASGD